MRLILTYFPDKKKPERTGKDGKGAIPDFRDKQYSEKRHGRRRFKLHLEKPEKRIEEVEKRKS